MRYLRDVLFGVGTIAIAVVAYQATTKNWIGGAQTALKSREIGGRWEEIKADGQMVGTMASPVIVAVFSDYQCPYCAVTHEALTKLERERAGAISVTYRHFPLTGIHPFATAAAVAADCAAAQGKFQAYADELFKRQTEIGATTWVQFARDAGVRDTIAFESCSGTGGITSRIAKDVALGKSIGVNATPTVLVNGKLLRPGADESELRAAIAEALATQRTVSQSGGKR